MTTTRWIPKSNTVKVWTNGIAQLRQQADNPQAQELAGIIERAINAALANVNAQRPQFPVTLDELPYHLPGQRLTIDLPDWA